MFWHMRYTITHNLHLVCSLHCNTPTVLQTAAGAGKKGKFWFPSLTWGGAGCIFGWRVTSNNEALMMIKQRPIVQWPHPFAPALNFPLYLWCHGFIGGIKLWHWFDSSLPSRPRHARIADYSPRQPDSLHYRSLKVCTFTSQVCFLSLIPGGVFCVLVCEVNKEWRSHKPGSARRHFLSVFTFTGAQQPPSHKQPPHAQPGVTFTEYFLRCFGLIIVHSMGNRRGTNKKIAMMTFDQSEANNQTPRAVSQWLPTCLD